MSNLKRSIGLLVAGLLSVAMISPDQCNAQNASSTSNNHDYTIQFDTVSNKPILVNHVDIEIRKNGTIKWEAVKKNDVPAGSKIITEFKIMFYSDASKSAPINCNTILINSSHSCELNQYAESKAQKVMGNIKCKTENCNQSTDPNASESYWFKIYDIQLEDKNTGQITQSPDDIDPRIIIKNQ